jgi:hypothetical protein
LVHFSHFGKPYQEISGNPVPKAAKSWIDNILDWSLGRYLYPSYQLLDIQEASVAFLIYVFQNNLGDW